MELAGISDWLKTNKLSFTIAKSKYMIFHTPQTKVTQLQLKIHNTNLETTYLNY